LLRKRPFFEKGRFLGCLMEFWMEMRVFIDSAGKNINRSVAECAMSCKKLKIERSINESAMFLLKRTI
jgi:transcription initiation factor TFIIIB Brf1 subunit/transcription initiation factor TFIIB